MGIITSPNVIGCEERQAHEEPRALLFRVRNPIQKGVYSFHAIKSFWSLELFKNALLLLKLSKIVLLYELSENVNYQCKE